MNRAKKFLGQLNEERQLVQYTQHGNTSRPVGSTHERLEPGIYNIGLDMEGRAVYTKTDVKSDVLLNTKNEKRSALLQEFKDFWSPEVKARFSEHGFTHKRGFIWEGPPGTGKSCDMKLLMREIEAMGDVAFLTEDAYSLTSILKQFKEVEPDRHVAVIMEDFENMTYGGGEHKLLELLDGPNAISGVFYLATTNHIESISDRLKRASRFDTTIHVGNPDYADRLEYLTQKLGTNESGENIEKLAKATEHCSFADLKDLIVNVYCFGKTIDSTLSEMKNQKLARRGSQYDERVFSAKMKESWNLLDQSINEGRATFKELLRGSIDPAHRALVTQVDYANKMIQNIWGPGGPEVQIHTRGEGMNMTETKSRASRFIEQVDRIDLDVEKPQEPVTATGNLPSDKAMMGGEFIDTKRIQREMKKRLIMLGIKNIAIQDVDFDKKGCIDITFADEQGEELTAEFCHDEEGEDGIHDYVAVDSLTINLGPLSPGILMTAYGKYLNLYELSWLDKATMLSILDAGEVEPGDSTEPAVNNVDAFGNKLSSTPGV